MDQGKQNLFVYGSLRDNMVFQSVCGLGFTRRLSRVDETTLYAEPSFLAGHRRVSPDNVYYYAVKSPSSRIEGLVIYDVPACTIRELDRYEGRYYKRDAVRVHTGHGMVEAQAYLVSPETMQIRFGDRFHVNLIHELWLRKRIGQFIKKHTRPGERSKDAEMERLADRELLGTTERDLVISHYGAQSISDYYIERELDRPRPSIRRLYSDPEAQPFIWNYLILVIKQVLLNQLDERLQSQYRYRLERMNASGRYYKRSASLLAALQMINSNSGAVDLIIDECIKTMPYDSHDLFDYVKYAVNAAASLFDKRVARSLLDRIEVNCQPGLIPLGCELELSNLGYAAIDPEPGVQRRLDPVYNGFQYFYDFRLDVLTWKLGGYIDDHQVRADLRRRYGFLELAPGRLSIGGEISRPASSGPWLMSQLIHEVMSFFDARPHSLHLSFQLRRRQVGCQRIMPLDFVKCLLVLGGGLETKSDGRLVISPISQREILQDRDGTEELIFARTSKRKWFVNPDACDRSPHRSSSFVQQYKFIRLQPRANYEPLILCLKGLQIAINPADYLTVDQLRAEPRLLEDYRELLRWAHAPDTLDSEAISAFMQAAHRGLMSEGHDRPAHSLHYIEWALNAVETQLRRFNQQVQGHLDSSLSES